MGARPGEVLSDYLYSLPDLMRQSLNEKTETECYQKLAEIYKRISGFQSQIADIDLLMSDQLIIVCRDFLVSGNSAPLNQSGGLRVLNQVAKLLIVFLQNNKKVTQKFRKFNIHVLICKIIEEAFYFGGKEKIGSHRVIARGHDRDRGQERGASTDRDKEEPKVLPEHTLNFFLILKTWVQFSPENYPALSLVCLRLAAESSLSSARKLKRPAIETLILLSTNNLELFCAGDGFSILLRGLLVKEGDDMKQTTSIAQLVFETFVQSIIDEENLRNELVASDALNVIFQTFYQYQGAWTESRGPSIQNPLDAQLAQTTLAKEFIKRVLQSPAGLFFFSEMPSNIQSMFELLSQNIVLKEVKDIILRLIEDLLAIQPSSGDGDCLQALRLKLLLDCGLARQMQEISQQEEFEERAKAIIQSLMKACSLYLPVKDRPNTSFLCYLFYEQPSRVKETREDSPVESEQTGLIVSKVNAILDNNFTEKLYRSYYSSDAKRSGFLFPIEDLYINTRNSYRDPRTSKSYPWTALLTHKETTQRDLNFMLESLPERWQVWDFDTIESFLIASLRDKNLAKEKLEKPFFRKFLGLFVMNDLLTLPWNPENFRYVKIVYRFFELVLNSTDEAAALLEKNLSYNPFNPFETFMSSVKKMLTQNRQSLRGTHIKLPKNCTFQQSPEDSRAFSEAHSRLSYIISENSFTQGGKRIGDKTAELELFEMFQVTLMREYIAVVGYLTFFPKGVAHLLSNGIFGAFKSLIERGEKYWNVVSVFMLTANHEIEEVQSLLHDCLRSNTRFLQILGLNILHFLLLAELYDVVLKFVEDILTLNALPRAPDKLKSFGAKLDAIHCESIRSFTFDILRRIVSETNHEVSVLSRMNEDSLIENAEFLDAIMRREGALRYLDQKGKLSQTYNEFVKNGGVQRLFDAHKKDLVQERQPLEVPERERYEYVYPHFELHKNQFVSESGVFLASVLRYPWAIRVMQIKEDSSNKVVIYAKVTFNPLKGCFEIVAETEDKNVLKLAPVNRVSNDWRFVASVFISNTMVNESLEMASEDNMFKESRVDSGCIEESNGMIVATRNGIDFLFDKSPEGDTSLKLRQVSLSVYLKPKKRISAEVSHTSVYELLSQNAFGVEFLAREQVVEGLFEKVLKSDEIEDRRVSLYCIGLIGKSEFGAALLQTHQDKIHTILNKTYTETPLFSIKSDIYVLANMLSENRVGIQILKSERSNWNVSFVWQRMFPTEQKRMLAYFTESSKRKPSSTVKKQNSFFQTIAKIPAQIATISSTFPINKLLLLMESDSSADVATLAKSATEGLLLFYLFVSYLSIPSDFPNSRRVRFWNVLTHLLKQDSVTSLLETYDNELFKRFTDTV